MTKNLIRIKLMFGVWE